MSTSLRLERLPLRERIYTDLRERIVRGELEPGQPVRDFEQADRLGASRTPVREALVRLVGDGLLLSPAGRGFLVPPLTRSEVEQAHPLIETLEPLALSLTPAPTAARTKELDRIVTQMSTSAPRKATPKRWNELDARWHRALIADCPNARLLRYIEELRDVLRRYELAYLGGVEDMAQSVEEHRDIAHSFATGRRDRAVRALTDHWQRGKAELLAIIPEETQA